MFKSFGAPELILILVIILIFFGVGKLPQVGAQFGKAIRAFKRAQEPDDKEPKPVDAAKPVTHQESEQPK